MTELLSREKELFKMNRELNSMVSYSPDTATTNPTIKNGTVNMHKVATFIKTEPRFGTYCKQKGATTLLKKQMMACENPSVPKRDPAQEATTNRTFTRTAVGGRQCTDAKSLPVPTGKEAATAIAGLPRNVNIRRSPPSTELTKPKTPCLASCSPRCENNIGTLSRNQTTSKTATYVKYRNLNFKESPSLDNIISSEMQLVMNESTTVVNGTAKKQLTQENFIKFLKAKVAILEDDHSRLSGDIAKHKEELEKATEAQRQANGRWEQALNTNKQLTEQLRKIEQMYADANRSKMERQQECTSQQQEFEQMKRDMRLSKQTNTNLENRLTRAQEELEIMRQSMAELRCEHRELQEAKRNELEAKEKSIKSLKRQRADLLNAYKKQLFMIENLKEQTNCLEQSMAVSFGEKEFNKLLEWNPKG